MVTSSGKNQSAQKEKNILRNLSNFRWDLSLFILIGTNLLTIYLAIIQKWNFPSLLFIYWCQSVIIGLFNFIKILNLKNFTTENFKINNRSVEPTESTRNSTAFFFLAHYGIFHIVYFIFLPSIAKSNIAIFPTIALGVGLFFVNHLLSFVINFKCDSKKKQNIGKVMLFPYARIIPMHLISLFGFLLFGTTGMIFFLLLKTLADAIMHNFEHQNLSNAPTRLFNSSEKNKFYLKFL